MLTEIDTAKVGDAALEIITNCMVLVERENTLMDVIKHYALVKLSHVYGYLIIERIGEYRNGY